MTPQSGETTDQFVARLRQQAQFCDFRDLEDQLRDQVIETMPHLGLRRKLLENANVTLGDALKIARAWEVATQQSRQMDRPSASSEPAAPASSAVHAVSLRRQQSRSQPSWKTEWKTECANCGRKGHRAGDSACPAKGKNLQEMWETQPLRREMSQHTITSFWRRFPTLCETTDRPATPQATCSTRIRTVRNTGEWRKTETPSQLRATLRASSTLDPLPPKHRV